MILLYNINIENSPGKYHSNVDALLPRPCVEHYDRAESGEHASKTSPCFLIGQKHSSIPLTTAETLDNKSELCMGNHTYPKSAGNSSRTRGRRIYPTCYSID